MAMCCSASRNLADLVTFNLVVVSSVFWLGSVVPPGVTRAPDILSSPATPLSSTPLPHSLLPKSTKTPFLITSSPLVDKIPIFKVSFGWKCLKRVSGQLWRQSLHYITFPNSTALFRAVAEKPNLCTVSISQWLFFHAEEEMLILWSTVAPFFA